jgi:hypothetical protein
VSEDPNEPNVVTNPLAGREQKRAKLIKENELAGRWPKYKDKGKNQT